MAVITDGKHGKLTEAERLEMAKLLIKSGYTVRTYKRVPTGAKVAEWVVEYWREGDKTNV